MGYAGEDDPLEILKDPVEGFALFRRCGGELGADAAGFGARQDRQVGDPLLIVGDPVDETVAEPAELLRRHVIGGVIAHGCLR